MALGPLGGLVGCRWHVLVAVLMALGPLGGLVVDQELVRPLGGLVGLRVVLAGSSLLLALSRCGLDASTTEGGSLHRATEGT